MVWLKVVIPAQAGIQARCNQLKHWIPVSTGMTKMGAYGLFTSSSDLIIWSFPNFLF